MANVHHLPKPIIESYEWQFEGACANLDVSEFFSPEAERGAAGHPRGPCGRRHGPLPVRSQAPRPGERNRAAGIHK